LVVLSSNFKEEEIEDCIARIGEKGEERSVNIIGLEEGRAIK